VKEQALIRRFWANESGTTAIEYGLIVGIMSLALVAIAATGGALDGMYERVRLIIAAIGGGD
jgi:Flp pilus assembly pilin Flp